MQETQAQSRGLEEPLEEEMATHSSIPAWKNPMDQVTWWATIHDVTESDTTELLSMQAHINNDLHCTNGRKRM